MEKTKEELAIEAKKLRAKELREKKKLEAEKKTPFGDVSSLKTHDGEAREINEERCYFYARDTFVQTGKKDAKVVKSLKILTARKFVKLYSPFSYGRALSFLKADRDYREIFAKYIDGSVLGILKLHALVENKDPHEVAKLFGMNVKSERKEIDSIIKELNYLKVSGGEKYKTELSDMLQMVDINGKQIYKEDLV